MNITKKIEMCIQVQQTMLRQEYHMKFVISYALQNKRKLLYPDGVWEYGCDILILRCHFHTTRCKKVAFRTSKAEVKRMACLLSIVLYFLQRRDWIFFQEDSPSDKSIPLSISILYASYSSQNMCIFA